MSFARTVGIAAVAGLALGAPGRGTAQTTYPNVKVQGRLHEQFYYFGNQDYAAATGPKINFFTRRARIEARGQINEYVTVYIQPSFEGGSGGAIEQLPLDSGHADQHRDHHLHQRHHRHPVA